MNYTFPETIFVDENTLEQQIEHIKSEFIEFTREIMCEKLGSADIEAADLYHSLETYFRMREKAGISMDEVTNTVRKKNQGRGYYRSET